MIESDAMNSFIIQIAFLIVFSVIFLIIFKRKWKISWKVVLSGSFTFLLFAIIFKNILFYFYYLLLGEWIPTYYSLEEWFEVADTWFVLSFAFATGVIEEVGRYWGYRFLLKEHRERKDGIAFGGL